MPLWTASNRLVLPKRDYTRRVLATRPYALVGYWPLDDLVGSTARNLARNATQLLANAGFELAGAGGADVFADWEEVATDGAIAQTTTAGEFRGGAAAAKLTAGTNKTTYISQTVPVLPGEYYPLSIWTRGDGTNPGRYAVYDETNLAYITNNTSTAVTAATYAEVSTGFTAPAGCVAASIYLLCPNAVGGIAYFDDVTVSRNLNGAYTGVDLTNRLGPFGRPAPFFDGTNDLVNIYSTALGGEISGAEVTIAAWCQVNAAAVWGDAALRRAISIRADANNWVRIQKYDAGGGAGGLSFYSTAGGTTVFVNTANLNRLGYFHVALTRSEAAGEVRGYLDGIQVGATQGTIGTWSGALSSTECAVGSLDTTPQQVWHGWLAHAAIWRAALNQTEIAGLARR